MCSFVSRVSLPFLFNLILEAISTRSCEWSSQRWRANIPLMFNSQGSQIQSAEIVLALNSVLMPNLSQYFWQAYCKSLKCWWRPAALINQYWAYFFVCYTSDWSVLQRSVCSARAVWCCSEVIGFCWVWQTALCLSASEPTPAAALRYQTGCPDLYLLAVSAPLVGQVNDSSAILWSDGCF